MPRRGAGSRSRTAPVSSTTSTTAGLLALVADSPGVPNYHAQTTSRGLLWDIGDQAARINVVLGQRQIQQLAASLGVSYMTLLDCRRVSRAYPPHSRQPQVSYCAHRVLASQPDCIALVARPGGWTVAEARRYVRDRTLEQVTADAAA